MPPLPENLWQKQQQQHRQPPPTPAQSRPRPSLWQRLYHAPLHWKLLLSSQLMFTMYMLDYRHRLVQKRRQELEPQHQPELQPQHDDSAAAAPAATSAPPRQHE